MFGFVIFLPCRFMSPEAILRYVILRFATLFFVTLRYLTLSFVDVIFLTFTLRLAMSRYVMLHCAP